MSIGQEAPASRHVMSLIPAWLVANILGGAIAGALDVQFQFLGLLVLAGIPVGFAQGFGLRPYLRRAWRWAVVTALAWPLANFLEVSLLQQPGDWVVQSLTGTGLLWEVFWMNLVRMGGVLALVAIPQGWLLWEQGLSPWVWIATSLVGGAVLGAIGATACLWWCPLLRGSVLGLLLGGTSWLGYALVTSLALKRLR